MYDEYISKCMEYIGSIDLEKKTGDLNGRLRWRWRWE